MPGAPGHEAPLDPLELMAVAYLAVFPQRVADVLKVLGEVFECVFVHGGSYEGRARFQSRTSTNFGAMARGVVAASGCFVALQPRCEPGVGIKHELCKRPVVAAVSCPCLERDWWWSRRDARLVAPAMALRARSRSRTGRSSLTCSTPC